MKTYVIKHKLQGELSKREYISDFFLNKQKISTIRENKIKSYLKIKLSDAD